MIFFDHNNPEWPKKLADMPNPLPLRYPYSKNHLGGFISYSELNLPNCTYIELFAGEAGVVCLFAVGRYRKLHYC